MAQQAARAETPPPSTDFTVVQKLEGLGRDWTALRECRLRPSDRGSSPTILIHPVRGVAVLDVSPSATPDAVDAVRARLDAARFDGIFAGHLPVVHLRATPRQMPSLPKMLDDAFAALPPLSLPGGDAWAGVAARALLAEQPAARRVEPQPSRGAAEDGRRQPRRRVRRRRRGSALRKAGAVLLCLAALGGVVAMVLKEAPLSDAFTRLAAPPTALFAPAAPPPALESAAPPQGVAALPALPHTSEPASPPPTLPAPSGDRTAAPLPDVPSLTPPSSPGEATPQRAVLAPPPRRAETPPQPTRKPPERAAAPQSQRRQQEAGADSPPIGGAAPPLDTASQRCSRIAARVGSGASLGEADMRFFNEACIRW